MAFQGRARLLVTTWSIAHGPCVRTYEGIFSLSWSWKTGSHNRLCQMRSFEISKICPTLSKIHCPRKVRTHVRTYASTLRVQWISETVGWIFKMSKDLIWPSLLWEPVFQDRLTKKSLLVPGRAPPQYLKFGLRRGFFAPNQKVQKRKYVFISPINTTRLVHSPNFDFGTLSPRLPVPRKPKLKRSMWDNIYANYLYMHRWLCNQLSRMCIFWDKRYHWQKEKLHPIRNINCHLKGSLLKAECCVGLLWPCTFLPD